MHHQGHTALARWYMKYVAPRLQVVHVQPLAETRKNSEH
jgi:hypothetical protein